MSAAVDPASTEELFNAAVDVIRDLPKNGSYQPSYQLMLRFYGFYKQATQGPCYQTKPAFWDVVGRVKWDAWNKLGNMSKEEAMEQYIEELKKQISEMVTQHRDETAKECVGSVSPAEREKIVETMSYTENIEKFMDVLGPFYEFLDLEAPDKKQLTNGDSDNDILVNGSGDAQLLEKGHIMRKSKEILSEKYTSDSDSENDEYADPIEVQVEDIKILKKLVTDHNDNDSGFADQVEFARSHNFQNGNVQQSNGVVNRDWIPYVLGESDSSCESPPIEIADVQTGTSVKGLVARGGGDEDGANGSGGPIGQRRGNQSADNRRQTGYRGVTKTLNQPNLGLLERQSAGVGGNGRGGPGRGQHLPDNISEQIAVALLRLQRDMDSVLARLNVLETVALAQHNTVHERFGTHLPMQRDLQASNKHSRHWWPFKDMSFRSFLFFLTWPVIVHVIIKILANRRARRRLRNC